MTRFFHSVFLLLFFLDKDSVISYGLLEQLKTLIILNFFSDCGALVVKTEIKKKKDQKLKPIRVEGKNEGLFFKRERKLVFFFIVKLNT